jgi:hypothetical protein
MFRWFIIIGVAIIAFSVLLQSRVDNIVRPEKDLQPVAVEGTKAAPVEAVRTEPSDSAERLTPVEERLRDRVPPEDGTAVSGDIVPM